jgi:hypothetical protein
MVAAAAAAAVVAKNVRLCILPPKKFYRSPQLSERKKLLATANAARSSVSKAIFCASMTSPATR